MLLKGTPPRAPRAPQRSAAPAATAARAGPARGNLVVRCSTEDVPSLSPKQCQQQQQAWHYAHSERAHAGICHAAAAHSVMGDADPPTSAPPAAPSTSTGQDQSALFRSLRQNRYWTDPRRGPLNLMDADRATLHGLPEVHVIVFGKDHDHEGVYSHRAMGKDGLPQDTIIGFEALGDAERYACMLEVTMEPHVPHVMRLPALDLADFCTERGYQCQVQPGGSHMLPPERNVDLTDWERSQRLRRDQFLVIDADDSGAAAAFSSGSTSSKAALDVLRRQLEALLPPAEEGEAADQ